MPPSARWPPFFGIFSGNGRNRASSEVGSGNAEGGKGKAEWGRGNAEVGMELTEFGEPEQ